MKTTIFLLLATFVTGTFLHAQTAQNISNGPQWQKIGAATVNFKGDKDQFLITGRNNFKSIQLRIGESPVRIEDVYVYYDGGDKENITVRNDFTAGSESQAIDLKNTTAQIRKVVFFYTTVPNRQVDKCHIELWGLK